MNLRETATTLLLGLGICTLGFLPSLAQENKPAGNPTSASGGKPAPSAGDTIDPEIIRLHLMDGSMLTGKLSVKEIAVDTDFGSLNVPVTSIRSFTPGLGSHPVLAKKISQLISDLGSGTYNEREAAQQELIKMGLSVRGELEKHAADTDTERRNRVKAILGEFDSQLEDLENSGDEKAEQAAKAYNSRDTIETVEFTIVGKIVPQSFSLASPYGDLTVKLADVRRAERDTGKKEDLRENFGVDASHFVHQGGLNTNLRVERGDVVTITADGTLTMTPWGNGQVSTPEGAQNFGWYIPNQIATGALVARLGPNDSWFKLGTKHNFTASRSGQLQLAIAMQADYNAEQFPGKYQVKIRVARK